MNPTIIQGGMGAGVSSWRLAKAVAQYGQMGVVSGTAFEVIMVRYLQLGDVGGHFRKALKHFPNQEIAQEVLDTYYIPNGKTKDEFKNVPMFNFKPSSLLIKLVVCTNFAQVWLAKEGHNGKVGVNYLEKIQMPHIYALFGAMLAGVDVVIVGAGIPVQFPGIINGIMEWEEICYRLSFIGGEKGDVGPVMTFNPKIFLGKTISLKKPDFMPIVSSTVLAKALAKGTENGVDGFIVEGYNAGGHNAPPRGREKTFNESGEPLYGEKDVVDLSKMPEGIPFYLAGGLASPEGLKLAQAQGAVGIQVGSIFALSLESGFAEYIKVQIRKAILDGSFKVITNAIASPTGFPFQILLIPGTLSVADVYKNRIRICNLGYLRSIRKIGGKFVLCCPSEPEDQWEKRGLDLEETIGRMCLCNALMAVVGVPQVGPDGNIEIPVITFGKEPPLEFINKHPNGYSAEKALVFLLEGGLK